MESLYEIGFMVLGRKSIYIVSAVTFIFATGIMMVYFIVFSDVISSLMAQLVFTSKEDKCSFVTKRTLYVLILGAVLFPFIIRKELKELKIISIILFFGIFSFIMILLAQLLIEGNNFNKDKDPSYLYPDDYADAIKGVSMMLVAFSF